MKSEQGQSPQLSAKRMRQRKFLLVAPVLVLPFLIFLLWTVGLVGEVKAENKKVAHQQGLNMTLPSAAPAKDSNWNKLKYYEQADKDSARLKSLLKNDPYRKLDFEIGDEQGLDIGLSATDKNKRPRYSYDPYPAEKQKDRNEERVYQKLAALNKELESAAMQEQQATRQRDTVREAAIRSSDVDRLENMMQAMSRPKGEDEEMKQLNDLMEKILDIQNPERVQEKIRQQSEQNKRLVYPVQKKREDVTSLLEPKKDFQEMLMQYKADSLPATMQIFMQSNQFYSLDEMQTETPLQNAIPAVVHDNQTLVSGATVKLRLLADVFIGGVRVPKDHFVYGTATLNGERLNVSIQTIQYQRYILPVALSVYDQKDGMPGINIPGAITRDVAKRSAAQSVQGLSSINTLDPSFGAQMATAGLQAAQNLIGRSAKLVKGTVPAGYAVLLKDDNQKDK